MGPHALEGSLILAQGGGSGLLAFAQAVLAAAEPAIAVAAATGARRAAPAPCHGQPAAGRRAFASDARPPVATAAGRVLRALAGSELPAAGRVAAAWRAPSARGIHTTPPVDAGSAAEVVEAVTAAKQQQIKDPSALSALAHAATAHATGGQLSPAQMRDLCVAFADLGFFDVGFKSAMAEAIIPKLPAFEPAVLADTMYAYGQAQYYDFELLTEAVAFLKSNADRFDATSLAKMLWSFGRCGYQDEALMDVMHSVAEKLADSCDSTSLADVVYAEAQMGWADQRLAELVAEYATDNIETFDAASLTRLLAGLASVGYDDDDLANAAGRHACKLLESGEMTPSQVVPLMWAYGLQGHYHKGLMSKAEAMLEDPKIVDSLTADELHTLIDACNNLGLHGPGISAAASRLGRLMPTIKDDKSEQPTRRHNAV